MRKRNSKTHSQILLSLPTMNLPLLVLGVLFRLRCETWPDFFIFASLISSFIGHTLYVDRPRCDNRADFFEIQFGADFRPANGKDDKLYQKHFRVKMRRILKQGRGCLNTTPCIWVFRNY